MNTYVLLVVPNISFADELLDTLQHHTTHDCHTTYLYRITPKEVLTTGNRLESIPTQTALELVHVDGLVPAVFSLPKVNCAPAVIGYTRSAGLLTTLASTFTTTLEELGLSVSDCNTFVRHVTAGKILCIIETDEPDRLIPKLSAYTVDEVKVGEHETL